jgi:HAD superfamily hydrolase (TIGR01509 family)
MTDLLSRPCWIFDMDGTLTVPIHDFDAIRRELGLPQGQPILESLAQLNAPESERLHCRLTEIERELALRARAQDDALALVAALREDGSRKLGIVTRNSLELTALTLEVIGLDRAFAPEHRVGRDEARPKPSPDGVRLLLDRWGVAPSEAVMVGDYLFDVQAGRAAGTATVLVDRLGRGPWSEVADITVTDLRDLLA